MKIACFSTKSYEQPFFEVALSGSGIELAYFDTRLTARTAPLARGFDGVCVFVQDVVDEEVLEQLADGGARLVALRCAGFNNVALPAAERLGIVVVRVPAYSPHAVAEHTVGLILALNRKLHRAYSRVREGNFSLAGLLGFDLHCRTVGVVGTGKIGRVAAQIVHGFGCRVLLHDLYPNDDCRRFGEYVPLETLYRESDIITLHCPLTAETKYLVCRESIAQMKDGVMLVNTSRGGLVDTSAVIAGLKNGKIGSLAIDVYEEEEALFFEDLSGTVIQDDVFARLLTFPNVLVTGHQAFFTEEALQAIAETTVANISDIAAGRPCPNQVRAAAEAAK